MSGYFCPICENEHDGFLPHGGNPPRPNRRCPICNSNHRQRLAWLFLGKYSNLHDGSPKRMLHVAPEPRLSERFRRIESLDYLSCDLEPGVAMAQVDITEMQFPDDSFDVIYCSHVLEHIPQDRKAMAEMYRVLRKGGWALILVPLRGDVTHEDETIVSPEDRERVFLQADHVRHYGRDIIKRLEDAGFAVREYSAPEIAGDVPLHSLGLTDNLNAHLFFCTK